MYFSKYLLITLILLGFAPQLIAQKPIGRFNSDTIQLGEVISYSIVFKHGSKQEVLFPDVNYNFYPFEFIDKIYFPTSTSNGISADSAIYQLRTFNIDSIQPLALPVFLLKNGDSTAVFSDKDSVYLKEEFVGNGIGQKLKANSAFIPMKIKLNWILIFVQIAIILVIAFVWWLTFGKTVTKQFKIFSLNRSHSDFKSNFNRYTKKINKTNIEKALLLWKNYMGKLKKQSFNTMTTPEIVKNIPYSNLNEALRIIDSSIYGNSISENISEAMDELNKLANWQHNARKKEIY